MYYYLFFQKYNKQSCVVRQLICKIFVLLETLSSLKYDI